MTADVLKICAGALIIAVSAFLLREFGFRSVAAFSVLTLAVFLGVLSDGLSEIASGISELASRSGVGEIAKEILKIIGASYVFGICSDICSELGEKSLAQALTVVGRVEILLIAMPYFLKITRHAAELVG